MNPVNSPPSRSATGWSFHYCYILNKVNFQEMNEDSKELLTLSTHAREGYSSHFVCLSVCHFSILEKALISG